METVAAPVVVKESRSGLGYGLFAVEAIERGSFVIEYTGKKIPTASADALMSRYLFEIDEDWTIDASASSNTARYINHSCEPNVEAEIRDGHIIISAKRNIAAGQELTIDYDTEYFEEFIRPVGCKCARCTDLGA